jgi:hypothetical protein
VLKDYQIQFLHHLVSYDVAFLIVRGQARWLADRSHKTRDLDVWVSIADEDKPNLESALIKWGRQHPAHTNVSWQAPLPLRPKVQIAFPQYDGVGYVDRAGEIQELSTADRIDVLTSLEGMDFKECFERSVQHHVDGVVVHAMCADDLDAAGQHRFKTEGRY